MDDGEGLREEILAALAEGTEAAWTEERFDRLARRVFGWQLARNEPYRRFCRAAGIDDPAQVRGWTEIPAIGTAAFKVTDLFCYPAEEARVVYTTSGTVFAGARGRHLLRDTRLYDAALVPNLAAHLFPDVEQLRIAVLAPGPADSPHSSLSHMLGAAVDRWGAPGSGFFMSPAGLDTGGLEGLLTKAEGTGEPVCLMGTAFAFVHLLDHLAGAGRTFRLPPGSRLMDTGGYKGRSRAVPKEELYRAYGTALGIPETHVVNEYGMTELSSQFYDAVLREHLRGQPPRRRKVAPPWVRAQVVDPETLGPVGPGETGLLRHFDLANVDSVMAIQTEDLGIRFEDGFEIVGRAAGAEPRGCSLAVEEAPR